MRSLQLLRESSGFIDELDSSTAVQSALGPWLHLLRDLADPRPSTDKIHDSIARYAVAPSHLHSERERVGRTLQNIEAHLAWLPLSAPPDHKTVRVHLALIDAEKREISSNFPHATAVARSTHAST